MLDSTYTLRYTIPMLESILLYSLASLGLVAVGFCVTFTYLTIRDELKEN